MKSKKCNINMHFAKSQQRDQCGTAEIGKWFSQSSKTAGPKTNVALKLFWASKIYTESIGVLKI
jgi:hypothetical protein